MFTKSENEKYCALHCACGCANGVVLNAEKDFYGHYYISLVSDNSYTSRLTGWSRFKEKCKRIWKILRNQEYQYFDICLTTKDIGEFKEFVAKL